MFIRPLKLRNGHIKWDNQCATIHEMFNYNVSLFKAEPHTFGELRNILVNFFQNDSWKSILKFVLPTEDYIPVITIYNELLKQEVIQLHHIPYLLADCTNTEGTLDGIRRQYRLYTFYPEEWYGSEIIWQSKYTTITLQQTNDGEYTIEELRVNTIKQNIALLDGRINNVSPGHNTTLYDTHMRHTQLTPAHNLSGVLQYLFAFYLDTSCVITPIEMPGVSQRNSRIRPSDLRRYLLQHPETEAKLQLNNNRGMYSLEVSIPVSYANRNILYRMFEYSTKVTSLLPFSVRQKNDKTGPLYGIELEVSTRHPIISLIDAQKKQLFFFCKADRSITGQFGNNVEIVTVPCSLASHRKLWHGFFKELPANKDMWDTTSKTNNGMHIHVSRRAFTDEEHIKRFMWFFANPYNYDFQYEISERHNRESLDQYARVPNINQSGRYNLNNLDHLTKVTHWMYRNMISLGHGAMVNLGAHATIEVRLFRGLVSFPTVMKNLEYVDAVLHFTQNKPLEDCTLQEFIHYQRRNVEKYPSLHLFIETIGIEELLLESKVQQTIGHLFNLNNTTPLNILTAIRNSDIPETPELVHYLNKKANEKTYYWNPIHDRIEYFNYEYARLEEHEHRLVEDAVYAQDMEMELGTIE
jgi:hypothetical protein